ncbi:hypothetical protein FOA52_003114 [Chlamydomonas sp. UWO 241]|nr:hypothetical protein FOA52_003114 [Chlamydomonas sp. UWO 241]
MVVRSPGKLMPAMVLTAAYQIAAIVRCTERGPARVTMARCQVLATSMAHALMHAMIAAQAAFGSPGGPSLRTELLIASAMNVLPLLLLLLLLTPEAAPAAGTGAGKAAAAATSAPKAPQPASPAAAAPGGAQAGADSLAPATDDPAGTSGADSFPRASIRTARAAAPTAAPDDGPTSQEMLPEYRSRLLSRAVTVTAKFPTLHLADHPDAATLAWRVTLRENLSSHLSKQASLQRGAPVSLRVVQLVIGAGCVVVQGRVFENGGDDVVASGDEVAAMLWAMGASDVLTRLLPEGSRLLDGDTAMLQLGDGVPPMELTYSAETGRFEEASRSRPPVVPPLGAPLLCAMWPLLALPDGGGGRVHLQFGIALLAAALGREPELVVSWVPSGNSAAPAPLFRAHVAALQLAARAHGSPPGLIDIDLDLGRRPSPGMFIAQLVDGDALLAASSVALLPASARPVVAELLRARLPADTLRGVSHDLGLLLCHWPRGLSGDTGELHCAATDLMEWAAPCSPALPALCALMDGLLRELGAGGAERGACNAELVM